MPAFKLVSDMPAAGDQPAAIDALAGALEGGEQAVTLLGVTGSGKTRSMAGVIERLETPDDTGRTVRLTVDLPPNLSLIHI